MLHVIGPTISWRFLSGPLSFLRLRPSWRVPLSALVFLSLRARRLDEETSPSLLPFHLTLAVPENTRARSKAKPGDRAITGEAAAAAAVVGATRMWTRKVFSVLTLAVPGGVFLHDHHHRAAIGATCCCDFYQPFAGARWAKAPDSCRGRPR